MDLDTEFREYHGKTKTVEYHTWQAMKSRCYNSNYDYYAYYGGRGIKVCDRWIESFEDFLKDMGLRPGDNYSIERIDSNGDYTPNNCIWATKMIQANNTSRNTHYSIGNARYTLAQWSVISGIDQKIITSRVKRGWSVIDAVFKPKRPMS